MRQANACRVRAVPHGNVSRALTEDNGPRRGEMKDLRFTFQCVTVYRVARYLAGISGTKNDGLCVE